MKKRYLATTIAFIIAMLGIGALWGLITLSNKLFGAEPVLPAQTSSTSIVLPPTPNEVEARLNEWRVAQGLAVFNSEVPALDQAAQFRAEDMCATNDWSHNKDWLILDQYYSYSYAGENLYYGSLQANQASKAVEGWSKSPAHHANMIADYSQVGIGVKPCPGFQGNANAVIITNYFGVPR